MKKADEIDPEKIRTWYNQQAVGHPESAGMLSPYGDDARLFARYRRDAEWLHFRRVVRLERPMRVLELGCGAGRWALQIAPFVHQVIGVDFSEEMVKLARERQRELGLDNVKFCVGPVQEAKPAGLFDLVYLSGLTQNLTEPQMRQTLANIRAMLAPKGTVIERTSVSLGTREVTDYGDGYQGIYRTAPELTALFGEFGFHLEYRALTHKRMRLPNRLLARKWFQKGMEAGLRAFPKPMVWLIGVITRFLEKTQPVTRAPETRSNDFFLFSKKA